MDDDESDDREESQMTGYVKFSVYKALFNAAKSRIYVILVIFVFIAAQVIYSGADYFIAQW